jgi:GAF domain-containing protein
MSGNHPGGPRPRMAVSAASGADLMDQLRDALERASQLVVALEANLRDAEHWRRATASDEGTDDLAARLAKTEADVHELAEQLAASERQAGRLMNLYVATYQLHASLLPTEVQTTIAEIAVNLLGAEHFVLLLRRDDGTGYEVTLSKGVDESAYPAFTGSVYAGGDPLVDATLSDGVLRLAEAAGDGVVCTVPLRVQGEVVGAIVILKLLDHKPSLRAEDRELLDLLSAHAASALFAARLFASTDRRLRSLESLVKLARGE